MNKIDLLLFVAFIPIICCIMWREIDLGAWGKVGIQHWELLDEHFWDLL